MSNVLKYLTCPWRHSGPALVAALVLSAGCAWQPDLAFEDLDVDPSLLSGERIFDEPIADAELPLLPFNEPSEAMLDYVERVVPASHDTSRRFQGLFRALHRDGYFDAVYAADSTLTAAETFEEQGGNCLSYTSMFVALARAAGLDAHYQVVDTPATWDADSGFLIRYTHINVVVRNVNLKSYPGQEVIVDFNDVHPDATYIRRAVSDEYAESLFYANLSVMLLRQGEHRASFANLRRAIDTAPGNIDLWINLGALYATLGDFDSSLEAYEVALQIEPRNKAAYSGLARSYAATGNYELAEQYEQRVRNYRKRNPYYHYALAQAAFEEGDFERSLGYIDAAIGLKRRTPRFHLLKGLVEQRLGQPEAAEVSFKRAQRFGLDQRVKLDLLRSLAGTTSS